MIYEVPPSRTGIGSVKTHSPTTSAAGSESTPLVRSWTSSMLMALLGAAATIAFLAAPASAVVMTSTQWNYDFNHLALTAGAAGSAESQASDFETQSTTSSPIGVSGNEGWSMGFSSTGLTKGTIYQYDATNKALKSQWYRTSNENYFTGIIGFSTTGTPVGNLKSMTVMPTATDPVRFYFTGLGGGFYNSGSQGVQWQFRIQQDAVDKIMVGPPNAVYSTTNPNWMFYTPGGTYNTGVPYVAGQLAAVEILADLVTGMGTMNLSLDGSQVYTNTATLVGSSGFNLRTLNNFNLFTKGGTVLNFGAEVVQPVPEPATLVLGGAGLVGVLLVSRFTRRRRA